MFRFFSRLACLSMFAVPVVSLAQNTPERVEVVTPATPHDGIFAIAPITSWTGMIKLAGSEQEATSITPKLKTWIAGVEALNGLTTSLIKPWHAVISYELFDRDGDHEHSGTIDELWAAPGQYRITYDSDNFHQTDFATPKGLYRVDDQRWPTPSELDARTTAFEPFSYAGSLRGFDPHLTQLASGSYTFDCTALNRTSKVFSGDSMLCFDPTTHALRYSHTSSWTQTAFNNIVSFQGKYIAREVTVTDGGHPSITLHIKTLETLPSVEGADFVPPPGASLIGGQRLSGVRLKPTHTEFPEWPSGIKERSFVVTVELVVGKDGHVASAHAVSGPDKARKAAEKTAMEWRFEPYLLLGQPAEVETKIELNQN